MADYTYTAKPASSWTKYDLDSYNISLAEQSVEEFFGDQALPDPAVDAELVQNLESKSMKSDHNAELIGLLDLAIINDSSIVDFAFELFRATDYVDRTRLVRRRNNLKLLVCWECRDATPDVCVIDRERNEIMVLLQEDRQKEPANVPAQLVAKALAAFSENNTILASSGLAPLQSKDMPGIVMAAKGSAIFYKIPVTQELVTHVSQGTYPPTATLVTFCIPPVPHPDLLEGEGMKPLENRREILKCYEAFKAIVGI